MAILSLDAIFNAGRVQSGLAKMANMVDTVGQRLRGVETSANRARSALRGMNAEQLSAAKVQGRGAGGMFPSERLGIAAEQFGISGLGPGGPTFSTAAEPQKILDQTRRSMDRLTQSTERLTNSGKKNTEQNRRQGVSFGQLLGLMIKFGIAMEIINIPGRIIGLFSGIVKGGAEAEASLAGVNALLRVSRDEIMDLGRATRIIAADLGVTGDAFAALEEAASSIGGFPASQVREMAGGITLANSELQTSIDLFGLAARASVAGGLQIEDAMRAATTITSGFNVSVKDAEVFMDLMFKTVDKGNIRMEELARNFGDLTGSMQLLFGSDPTRQVKEFEAVMVGLATATRTLTPAEAITAQRNLLKGFVDASSESLKLRNRLKELGVNLQVNDIVAQGYEATLREINDTIGVQGRITSMLVEANKEQVAVMGEANFRQATFVKLITGLFPNIRQVRSIQAQLNNEMKLYNEIAIDFADATGETNKQLKIRQETVANSLATFRQFINLIKEELFFTIGVPLGNALRQVNKFIEQITSSDQFRSADFIGKLGMLWEGFITAFNKWWTGGGQQKTTDIATLIGGTVGTIIAEFLLKPDTAAKFVEVGTVLGLNISKGIIIGIGKNLDPVSRFEKIEQRGLELEQISRKTGRSPFEQRLSNVNRFLDTLTFNQLPNPDFPDRAVFGIPRDRINITVENIQVGNSAEEVGQVILDLAAGLDEGSIAAPRDDRINNP